MMTQYVIAIKRIRTYYGNEPTEVWEFAHYDYYSGSFSTGYPVFGSECHAITFDSVELAETWWKENSQYIHYDNNYVLSTLNVYERTYQKVESNISVLMNSKELLQRLQEKYSFEKAYSILQIATEDREFENKDVEIIMTRTLANDMFCMKWR